MCGKWYGADGYVAARVVLVYGRYVAAAGNYPDVGMLTEVVGRSAVGYVSDGNGYADTVELVYSPGDGDGSLSESVG